MINKVVNSLVFESRWSYLWECFDFEYDYTVPVVVKVGNVETEHTKKDAVVSRHFAFKVKVSFELGKVNNGTNIDFNLYTSTTIIYIMIQIS